jgi:GPI-GlcNAc transferase complex, PIG-H component
VLRGLGVQTTSSSSTYLSTATTRFIPTTAIQDIFIHEAFKGFEVRFYLAIVVESEEDVVVVFPVSPSSLRICMVNNSVRIYYQVEPFSRMFGVELVNVCMSRRLDFM